MLKLTSILIYIEIDANIDVVVGAVVIVVVASIVVVISVIYHCLCPTPFQY